MDKDAKITPEIVEIIHATVSSVYEPTVDAVMDTEINPEIVTY